MIEDKKTKVINFLQDFGCAKLEQLQTLFNDKADNFKYILTGNTISKKNNIFVHNTKKVDNKMLTAIEILCKYKKRLSRFYRGYYPIYITFLTKENLVYHIIIADEENKKGIIKLINSYPLSLPQADKLILAFEDKEELDNINCDLPFLYCTYPELTIINSE